MKEAFLAKVKQFVEENNLTYTDLEEKAKIVAQLSKPEQLTDDYATLFCDNYEIWEVSPLCEIVLADNWATELLEAKTEEVRDQITAEIASYADKIPAENLLLLSEDIIKGNQVLVRDYIVMLISGSAALDIIEQSKATLIESLTGLTDIYKKYLDK